MSETESFVLTALDIPETTGERTKVEDAFACAQRFAFLGSGAAGGRIADTFRKLGYGRVLAFNTTMKDTAGLGCPKLIIETGGTGKDPEKGRLAVLQNKGKIADAMRSAWGDEVDRIFICVGAGGGTGTGTALPLVEAVRQYADLVHLPEPIRDRIGIIATIPKRNEGSNVHANAHKLLEELFASVGTVFGTLTTLDNDRVASMYPHVSKADYWPTVNKHFAQLFHVFNILANHVSEFDTFDPTEYETVLKSGIIAFGASRVRDLSRTGLSEAMRAALDNNFLADGTDLSTATTAAAIVVGDRKTLGSIEGQDFDHAWALLRDALDIKDVFPGVYVHDAPTLDVFTMIGGLKPPDDRLRELAGRGGI